MARPKNTFNAGDPILAEEVNENFEEVWKEVNLYGESEEGSDAYAIELGLTELKKGMIIAFKADVANVDRTYTTSCTLNVDNLGAKEILKISDDGLIRLDSGDIQAGQIVLVVYDGTQFQYINKPIKYNQGIEYRSTSVGSGDQTIAHGLKSIPKKIRIIGTIDSECGGEVLSSIGSATYYKQELIEGYYQEGYTQRVIALGFGALTGANILFCGDKQAGGGKGNVIARIKSADKTNFVLEWTVSGTPPQESTGFLWEVEA